MRSSYKKYRLKIMVDIVKQLDNRGIAYDIEDDEITIEGSNNIKLCLTGDIHGGVMLKAFFKHPSSAVYNEDKEYPILIASYLEDENMVGRIINKILKAEEENLFSSMMVRLYNDLRSNAKYSQVDFKQEERDNGLINIISFDVLELILSRYNGDSVITIDITKKYFVQQIKLGLTTLKIDDIYKVVNTFIENAEESNKLMEDIHNDVL